MKERFYIAGVQYHDYRKALDFIQVGDLLNLFRDFGNEHDPNAVKILANQFFLGFVPGKFSQMVAEAMAQGPVSCELVEIDREAKPWRMFLVEVVS